MKGLPRNCGKNPDRAFRFTEEQLLPKLKELYGSLEFFIYCCNKTTSGHTLLREWTEQQSIITQNTHEDAIVLGRQQMADAIQQQYDLNGLLSERGLSSSQRCFARNRDLYLEDTSKDRVPQREKPPAILLNHRELITLLINQGVQLLLQQKEEIRWKKVEQFVVENVPPDTNQSLLQWLLNGRSRGTFFKTLYLDQVPEWREEWNETLQQRGGVENMNEVDWTSLLAEEDPLREQASFLLPLAYSHLHGQASQRKSRIKILGVKIPIYPSTYKNQKNLMEKLLWEDEAKDLSDSNFAEEVRKGRIYLGKHISRTFLVRKTQLTSSGCQRNIRRIFTEILVRHADSGYLKLEAQDNTFFFFDWWDACPIFGRSLFAWNVGLIFKENLFAPHAPVTKVTQPFPWLLGWFPETAEAIGTFRKIEATQIEDLASHPIRFNISGREYIFRLVPLVGQCDHSAGRKAHGNNAAGIWRCGQCSANFESSNISLLFQFHQMNKLYRKTLENARDLFSTTEGKVRAMKMGWKELPPILNGDVATSLAERNLHHYSIGPDNLHNGKGVFKTILEWEMKQKGWKDNEFLINLNKSMGEAGTAMFNGAQWRLMLVLYPSKCCRIAVNSLRDPVYCLC